MTTQLSNVIDKRIVRIGIVIDNNVNWYEGLNVQVKGIKVSNTIAAQCEIVILNLRREVREYILKETNTFLNKGNNISVIVEVGRESYGVSTLYEGDVFRSNPTPKPDMGVRLTCLAGFFNKSKIVTRSSKEITDLSNVAQWVADDNNLNLSFEIPDKKITRYSFTGSAESQLLELESLAMCDVYVDSKTLYLKNTGVASNSSGAFKLDKYNGLIKADGTEIGAKAQFLYNPTAIIGGQINIESELNPSLNGDYVIYKLAFHITSREQPFYYVAECNRIS